MLSSCGFALLVQRSFNRKDKSQIWQYYRGLRLLDIKCKSVRKAGEVAEGLSFDVQIVFGIPVTWIVFRFLGDPSFKLLYFFLRQYLQEI